jgi:hypothetical protein
MLGKIRFPGLGNGEIGDEEQAVVGRARFAQKAHPGFFWGAVALLEVAASASGDQILPAGRSSPAARDHVVHGELPPVAAAVLTGISIPTEDVPPIKGKPPWGAANQFAKPDHAGYRKGLARGLEIGPALFKDLCAAVHDQHHRPPHAREP